MRPVPFSPTHDAPGWPHNRPTHTELKLAPVPDSEPLSSPLLRCITVRRRRNSGSIVNVQQAGQMKAWLMGARFIVIIIRRLVLALFPRKDFL